MLYRLVVLACAAAVGVHAAEPAAAPVCRLRIPNSGGASQRPASFARADVTAVMVPPNSFSGPPELLEDFCGGSPACERVCCDTPSCFAWGWTVAGSVHALCGSNTCEIFLFSGSATGWPAAALTATLWGGYNYAGYILHNETEKTECCSAVDATASPSAPAPPPPPAASPSSSAAPAPALSALPAASASASAPALVPAPASASASAPALVPAPASASASAPAPASPSASSTRATSPGGVGGGGPALLPSPSSALGVGGSPLPATPAPSLGTGATPQASSSGAARAGAGGAAAALSFALAVVVVAVSSVRTSA